MTYYALIITETFNKIANTFLKSANTTNFRTHETSICDILNNIALLADFINA